MLKSVNKNTEFSPTELDSETETDMSALDQEALANLSPQRTIRVLDRFGLILQIFALRAKNRTSQIQIELAWLNYARSLVYRGGAPTFGQLGSMFDGNLMR